MAFGKVIVFDTSVLCCWLKIPGKDQCGPSSDRWNYDRINQLVQEEQEQKSTFVLPLATIIETGNHIAQANGKGRRSLALALSELIIKSAEAKEPWAAFRHQAELWSEERMNVFAKEWPSFAVQGLGIGDATIKDVAEYYARIRNGGVEILTGDDGLKAYQPSAPSRKGPRRRR